MFQKYFYLPRTGLKFVYVADVFSWARRQRLVTSLPASTAAEVYTSLVRPGSWHSVTRVWVSTSSRCVIV